MISLIINTFKVFHKSISKSEIRRLLVIGIISLLTCSILFYIIEKSANNELTIVDSLWWGFVTITTVGYGDFFPVTLPGRIISIILMVIGITTFGFLTAAIASIFVENKLKKGMGLMNIEFTDHIVVIGWNIKTQTIIDELVNDNPDKKIVIVADIERLDLEHKNVYFVHGDPTVDETLIKSNISQASTSIIVADDNLKSSNGMADAKSVLICLAIDKLNPNIHIIAEVLNEENVPHFERANVNDIVISNQMSSRVMVRSAIYKNVSMVLKELMTNSFGNEIYECKVSKKDVGLTFSQLSSKYLTEHNSIIIAIANNNVKLNPNPSRITEREDIIIYISDTKLQSDLDNVTA